MSGSASWSSSWSPSGDVDDDDDDDNDVPISLADIIGFLHFWDITIDTISCINIVFSVGLCVDYSVHTMTMIIVMIVIMMIVIIMVMIMMIMMIIIVIVMIMIMIGPHWPRLPGRQGVETAEDGGGSDDDR